MTQLTILDAQELAEGWDLEVKRAGGRDGRGHLPDSFFETYSAMANTDGGVILLGVDQPTRGAFVVTGIADPERVLTDLWNALNNRQRVSANILQRSDVDTPDVGDKTIIRVRVPRAHRKQRPVYVGQNPLAGTFRRNYDGDVRCSEETVKRMLAEQVEDSRDEMILEGYDESDLDEATLRAYRNQFRAARPNHPWADLDTREFLQMLGAWGRDRATGREGLTIAGVLMFGEFRSIHDAVRYYVVDYQERPVNDDAVRWIDRVTTDGTWSGNLYDFYRRVIQKLVADLKVPFRLEGTQRIDDTPVHEALREALVNTLIHADYTGSTPILVVKHPHGFSFRNPGTMRLPLEDVLDGGNSDCRNRNLQKMFQFAGLGEQAGSGVPRIFKNWREQHWRAPRLWDEIDPDRTELELRMVSLLPEETLHELDQRFGPAFRGLSEDQRLALATVAIEGLVTNARLQQMTTTHPRDLTQALAALVRGGFLVSAGAARGTYYVFPEELIDGISADQIATRNGLTQAPAKSRKLPQTPAKPRKVPRLPAKSRRAPQIPATSKNELTELHLDNPDVSAVRSHSWVPRTTLERAILTICQDRFVTLADLALALSRSQRTLAENYLIPMVKDRRIELRYPGVPGHPDQGYRTAKLQ